MKTICIKYRTVATLLAAAHMLAPISAHAEIKVVAIAGDHAPDGNGVFSAFGPPTINDTGQTVFDAGLVGTRGGQSDSAGIFMSNGDTLTQVVRRGQMIPDGSGSFAFPAFDPFAGEAFPPALNAAGQVAFQPLFPLSIFLSSPSSGTLAQIVRAEQPAPDGNGVFGNDEFLLPSLNDSGQVAFFAQLTDTSDRLSETGIFRGDGSTLTQIARGGQLAPDGNGLFIIPRVGQLVLNNDGLVTLGTNFDTATPLPGSGVVLSDGATQTLVARSGGATPDGAGTFGSFGPPLLNDGGQLAFSATVAGPVGSFTGIYFRSGATLTEVSRIRPLSMSLNNAGQLAVTSVDPSAGGISKIDTTSKKQTLVVSPHQAAPDGNGILALLVDSGPSPVTINNVGQIAFSSLLVEGSPGFLNDIGVFL